MKNALIGLEARKLVRARVLNSLCPICNLKVSSPKNSEFEGKGVQICGQHVTHMGIIPIVSIKGNVPFKEEVIIQ